MKQTRKKNNIFNQLILPENFLDDRDHAQYKIGGLKVDSNWLQSQPPSLYRPHIKSAFQLTQLIQKYETLEESEKQRNPTDMFMMVQLKKRIDNFKVEGESPKKQLSKRKIFPTEFGLTLQKVADFWGSSYIRKCRLINRVLEVQSEKEKKVKVIDCTNYTFEYQERNHTQLHQQSKKFQWLSEKNQRLFLYQKNQRCYCLYGEAKDLKTIIKKLQIENVEERKIKVFHVLHKQFYQKVITLFGSKLRIYENYNKEKKKKNQNAVKASLIKEEMAKKIQLSFSKKEKQDKIQNKSEDQLHKSNPKKSQRSSTPKSPTRNMSTIGGSGFKLKCRRSTVHYNELQNQQQVIYSPDFKVGDINLDINEVAYSQEEAVDKSSEFEEDQNKVMEQEFIFKRNNTLNEKNFESLPVEMEEIKDDKSYSNLQSKSHKSKEHYQKFNIVEKEKKFNLLIEYFEEFFPYSQQFLTFELVQLASAYEISEVMTSEGREIVATMETESENMKKNIYFSQKFIFMRDEKDKEKFVPKLPVKLKISNLSEDFLFLLDEHTNEYSCSFKIEGIQHLKVQKDCSSFIYIKSRQKNEKFKLVGKLRIIVSPDTIDENSLAEDKTISFLSDYLWASSPNYKKKMNFVSCKRRHYEVKKCWNDIIIKKMVNKSLEHPEYQEEFTKAVFYGLPTSIYNKIIKIVQKQKKPKEKFTLKMDLDTLFMNQLEKNISSKRIYDLRVFMPMAELIKLTMGLPKNEYLNNRISQVILFFRYKYGSVFFQRVIMAIVKEILLKCESLLLRAKTHDEVVLILTEYLNLEYQIDGIFMKVAEYFN